MTVTVFFRPDIFIMCISCQYALYYNPFFLFSIFFYGSIKDIITECIDKEAAFEKMI